MGDTELKLADILALDRTKMAAERTLMAWVRTAFSMMTFGFTIFKILQVLQDRGTVSGSPHRLGLMLTGIGTFALVAACAQHWRYVRDLRPDKPYKPWDLTFIVACLVVCLGLVIFWSLLLNTGPLA